VGLNYYHLKYLRIYEVQRKIYTIQNYMVRRGLIYGNNNFCPGGGVSEISRTPSFFKWVRYVFFHNLIKFKTSLELVTQNYWTKIIGPYFIDEYLIRNSYANFLEHKLGPLLEDLLLITRTTNYVAGTTNYVVPAWWMSCSFFIGCNKKIAGLDVVFYLFLFNNFVS